MPEPRNLRLFSTVIDWAKEMNGLAGERVLFSYLLSELEIYAHAKGYDLARDEGRVFRERKVHEGNSIGIRVDAVHSLDSFHYRGLAQDYVLYIDDIWISSSHPAWIDLSNHWKKLNPKCTWGGDFKTGTKNDLNHFSFGEGQ